MSSEKRFKLKFFLNILRLFKYNEKQKLFSKRGFFQMHYLEKLSFKLYTILTYCLKLSYKYIHNFKFIFVNLFLNYG